MASGRQLAEQNFQVFKAWIAAKTDDEFRAMVSRGVLSREEIARECGFSPSPLAQNPRIRKALNDLEGELRERGVLPPLVERSSESMASLKSRAPSGMRAMLDAERLKSLEQQNASLRAEVQELKKQLERFTTLREALALTGRVPR